MLGKVSAASKGCYWIDGNYPFLAAYTCEGGSPPPFSMNKKRSYGIQQTPVRYSYCGKIIKNPYGMLHLAPPPPPTEKKSRTGCLSTYPVRYTHLQLKGNPVRYPSRDQKEIPYGIFSYTVRFLHNALKTNPVRYLSPCTDKQSRTVC